MSGRKSPQELFPNLFASRPADPRAEDMHPIDMRLLQYAMRKAGQSRPTLTRPTQGPTRPVGAPRLSAPPSRRPGR